jgi:hypothetical protein
MTKIMENGKGQAIALSLLSIAFASWAWVVNFAADDISSALDGQTIIMEQIRQEQGEMRVRIRALEIRVEQLQKDMDKE